MQWRAPHFRVVFPYGTQADYKAPVELKSCLSEFHHKPFDVAFIKEAEGINAIRLLNFLI